MIAISLQLTKPLSERHDTGAIYKKFTIRHLTELVPKVRCTYITCEKYSTNLKVYILIDLTLVFLFVFLCNKCLLYNAFNLGYCGLYTNTSFLAVFFL